MSLCHSTYVFQMATEMVLEGLIGISVMIYVDYLDECSDNTRQYNLTLNPKKCEYEQKELKSAKKRSRQARTQGQC